MGYGQKRGGAPGGSSIVSCEMLHSRGDENDTGEVGGRMLPPPPPLKYGPDTYVGRMLGTTYFHVHSMTICTYNVVLCDVEVCPPGHCLHVVLLTCCPM